MATTTFANSAARLAFEGDPVRDLNKYFKQIDTATVYRKVRSGAGSDVWELAYVSEDLTTSLSFSLYDFREVDANSDVGAIAANGGILASDTTPIMRGDTAESAEISWATGNVDAITIQKDLPDNFDGASPVVLTLTVSSGTTNGASFTVETGWDGGALVSDSVDDSATKSATKHDVTVTIAAADIPDTAKKLTLVLTPPTHATDTIQLHGIGGTCERVGVA